MKKLTYLIAFILIAIGLVGYFGWEMIGAAEQSWTNLIASALGLIMLIGAIIANKKHAVGMHIAVLGALFGVLAIGRAASTGFDFSKASTKLITVTSVICLIYMIFAIRSFIAARRARS